MRFPGFIGPSYTLRTLNVDCQRTVNLYPEINELGNGKEKEVASLISTPGLRLAKSVGTGPIRLIHCDPALRVFVVSGATIYQFTQAEGTWTATSIGTLDTSTGIVKAASSDIHTVFVDGQENYAYVNGTSTFSSYTTLGYSGVPTATHVDFIDGYYIFNEYGTNKFYTSDLNDLTVGALEFASAEGNPDEIMGLIALNRDLILFNSKTTEIYADNGNPDFPFQRISGGFIEQGCMARFSIAKIAGAVLWLGRDETGNGSVFMAKGMAPQRVSTHAVESAIQSYGDISTAVAFAYQASGHHFYVLNFTQATWVYDVSTQMWHERAYTNNGSLERHRANVHAFIPDLAIHLVGDYEDGNVYQLDDSYYSDNGDAITRLRASPHVSSNGTWVWCNSFQLDMETGVGVDGNGQGIDPQAMFQFSDDGGHTWSTEEWTAIGARGDRRARVIWRRLGKFRDRVFRVMITDPVKVTLIGAELDVEKGMS
jgi:hypothetical protein